MTLDGGAFYGWALALLASLIIHIIYLIMGFYDLIFMIIIFRLLVQYFIIIFLYQFIHPIFLYQVISLRQVIKFLFISFARSQTSCSAARSLFSSIPITTLFQFSHPIFIIIFCFLLPFILFFINVFLLLNFLHFYVNFFWLIPFSILFIQQFKFYINTIQLL